MDAITNPTRQLRERLGAEVYRRSLQGLPNPSRWWHGVDDPRLRQVRMFRIGDCSWQAIEHAHAWGQPGYPALLAEQLRSRGVALHFDDCFVGDYRDATPELLSRVCKQRPDVIIVQIGSTGNVRELVPLERRGLAVARMRVNHHTGRLGGINHRYVVRPLLSRFGKPAAEPVTAETIRAGQQQIAGWIEQTYPGVPWAELSHQLPIATGWLDRERVARMNRMVLEGASEAGAVPIDINPALEAAWAGREREVRNATGYDLRLAGHQPIADLLLHWMQDLGLSDAAHRALEPAAA